MPADFVDRFSQLGELANKLAPVQDNLNDLDVAPVDETASAEGAFTPKDKSDYWRHVEGGKKRVTRVHEALVNDVSKLLSVSVNTTNPHPIDLVIHTSPPVIVEAKTVKFSALRSVRDAVGQLLEYQEFNSEGLSGAKLAVLLNAPPGSDHLVDYVEGRLGFLFTWFTEGELHSGPQSARWLHSRQVEVATT